MGDAGKIVTGAVIFGDRMIIQRFCIFPVQGPIDPANLGVTLTHEHLLLNFEKALQRPSYLGASTDLTDLEFSLENVGIIRQYP